MASVNDNIVARSDIDPTTDARMIALIALATERTFSSCYSTATKNSLIALWALHWYTLSPSGTGSAGSGVVGSVKSEKEGDLAISYGGNIQFNQSQAYLAQTQFGLEILNIQSSNIFKPRTKMMGAC